MFHIKRCCGYKEMSNIMINDFIEHIERLLNEKDLLNIAIATGSTLEYFIELLKQKRIPFNRINLYIVDEYVGIEFSDQRSCTIDLIGPLNGIDSEFCSINIFSVHGYMNEMADYHEELSKHGLDICILGVGKDGHVGFCYPPIEKDINKFYWLRKLNDYRKKEHVLNGWFPSISHVPDYIITLSLWGIFQSAVIMIGAIYSEKENTIIQILKQEISAYDCPIMYFVNHENITLYLG